MTALLVFIALLAPGASAVQPVAVPSAATVAANVQKFYAQTPTFTADFTQVVTNTTFGTTATSTGTVALAKPDKMHWTYVKRGKLDKEFIYDGTTLWAVDHGNKEIVKAAVSASTLPIAIAFLNGTASLGQINLALSTDGTHGGKGATVLALSPKQPSAQWAQLYLVVDPTDFHVTESIVVVPTGDSNDFTFTKIGAPAQLPASVFTFDPAKSSLYKLETAATAPAGGANGAPAAIGPQLPGGKSSGAPAPKTGTPSAHISLARNHALDKTTLTEPVVAKVLGTDVPALRKCYAAALKRDPGAAGNVIADVTVSAEGKPTVKSVKAFDTDLATCVTTAAAGWRFPAPNDDAGKPTTARFMWIFKMTTRS